MILPFHFGWLGPRTSIGVKKANEPRGIQVPNGENYGAAAIRHFADAELLAKDQRWDGAGHLVGFAAECALKHKIDTLQPRGAPHCHFPEILGVARRHLNRRRHTAIHAILKLPNLMEGWNVSLRYSGDAAVDEGKYGLWRDHAARLVGAAGLRRSN
jgi:hypothetical protein